MMGYNGVTRREWRWVLILSAVALAATSVPYLAGWMQSSPDHIFGGCILLVDDCYSYLAKMRLGAEGAWLFRIVHTSEAHEGAFLYTFYLALGKLAVLLPIGDLATRLVWGYHGARMMLGLGLLLTVYRFLAAFTARAAVRRLAWLMVAFGGGLGWLLVLLGRSTWWGTPPLDFYLPEGFGLLVLYGFPHLALAQALLLWGVLFFLRSWGALPAEELDRQQDAGKLARMPPRWRRSLSLPREWERLGWGAAAGLAWLLMGLVLPFYVAVGWAVMGAAWWALLVRERRILWQEATWGVVMVLISSPVPLYSAWVFSTDPVYRAWAAQNQILSPHPLHFLSAYGVALALACFAARDVWRADGPGWLTVVWVCVAPVLLYLPFNLQRRLIVGAQAPLSLLAAWGAIKLWRGGKRWLLGALIATMIPTGLILLLGGSAWMLSCPPLVFRDRGEVAALDWLDKRIQPDDVVLTAYDTGNYLPVRVFGRVFLGHGLETVDAEVKEAQVARFFDVRTDDDWRRNLLMAYGIDYVFWGPAERALGAFDPHNTPYLQSIYEVNGYAVFEVGEVEP
ncbi:MAG TPA: hypothetical protein ENN19_03305 [Chloroflexi bacterium]|nr:hypothetical protein [Chloroflexota bacterium]